VAPSFDEQVERFVDNVVRAGVGTINLVDDDNRAMPRLQCFAQHEPRLRHRTIDSIDQQQHAIDHIHHTFDFPAEVGVSWRIDDIDLDAAIGDGGILRHNCNAAFALQIIRVQHALSNLLIIAENATLTQQPIDQRGLAVVHVGNNRNVPNIVPSDHLVHP
jgi:hypothetical protein